MYRVLNNEAPEYLSNLYTHIPSCYSNSRNSLSLDRHIQNKYIFLSCFSMEQPTSDSQILSVTQFLQANISCTPLSSVYRMDCDVILLGREKQTVRYSSDCHCNDWSFETNFIHPQNSAQSFGLLVRVTPPPLHPPPLTPYCSL